MQANQMTPAPIVMRSRLRSATEEPPRPLETPPPNMSERPPPRPLWSRTSRMSNRLVRMSSTVKVMTTVGNSNPRGQVLDDRHVVEPADPTELVGLQARAADQGTVDVGLLHDRGDVRGLHRSAVQDAQAGRGL